MRGGCVDGVAGRRGCDGGCNVVSDLGTVLFCLGPSDVALLPVAGILVEGCCTLGWVPSTACWSPPGRTVGAASRG